MAEESKVTSRDIKIALAKRHMGRDLFFEECKNGPTGTGTLIFDALAIAKSWAHPNIIGYEVKVSRGDFHRDNKYSQYRKYVNEFYFVVPTGLIERAEVEDNIGLIYYNPKTMQLTTKRKAIYDSTIQPDTEMLMYILMNRGYGDHIPFYSTTKEYFQAWLDNKRDNRELSYAVKSKLVNQLRVLEEENRRYSRAKEEDKQFSRIIEVLRKHDIHTWGNYEEQLDKALSNGRPPKLDIAISQMQNALSNLLEMANSEVQE